MSRRLLCFVNEVRQLKPDQTTTALLARAAEMGLDTWVAGAGAIELAEPGVARAHAYPVCSDDPARVVATLGPPASVALADVDRVHLRTNPARDRRRWAAPILLQALELAEAAGVQVVNPTRALRLLGNKPGCFALPPAIRPRSLMTRDLDAIRAFAAEEGRCVLKPASGTHGSGVFLLEQGDRNLGAAAALLASTGPVVVQEWLPEAADGDVRLFLVDGEPFSVDGRVAAVRRRPAPGELRSNVHLGGIPEPTDIDAALERVIAHAGPVLRAWGVRVAGLDCIGDRVVELNLYAPGGLGDAGRFYGRDYVGALVRAIMR